jgi:hypothetical protein
MQELQHLVIDVSYENGDKNAIRLVSTRNERLFSNITKDKLPSYLNQQRSDGWDFVHKHGVEPKIDLYYFKRSKR